VWKLVKKIENVNTINLSCKSLIMNYELDRQEDKQSLDKEVGEKITQENPKLPL
jgi:hypothetical protein